ncbi:MAG: hypothetical protein WC505_03885 [Patescibacteria group bacterium]
MYSSFNSQRGQSVIELIVAMGVFVLVVSSVMFLTLDAHSANRQGKERTRAALLAQETHEAAVSIANRGWRDLADGAYGIDRSGGTWALSPVPNVIDDTFVRTVTVEPAQRDASGNIVEAGGTVDFDTKKLTATLTWDFTTSRPSEVSLTSYLTNWQSLKWVQTTEADFNQGTLSSAVATGTDGGDVRLVEAGVPPHFISPFDDPAGYTFDPADIEITGSVAQLVNQSISASGGTTNPGFDAALTPWQYADWNQGGDEVNVRGLRQLSGGDPGGYAEIIIPQGTYDEVGGYFRQSFTVTESNPETAYVSFDGSVLAFNGIPVTLEAFVFVDSAPGEPVVGTEVWSSGELTGTAPWTSIGPIDVASRIAAPGTYYLKLAVWVESDRTRDGLFRIGFDDARLNWEKIGTPSYPADEPPITPTASFSSADVYAWHSFEEIATKNGGEIYYQLSDDDGATWQYWDGGTWIVVTSDTDFNTAAEINSHILSFPAGAQRLLFRAFLSSDGAQQVSLDAVRVTYDAVRAFDSTFDIPADYSFDSGDIEVIDSAAQLVNQSPTLSGGTANSGFDLELKPWEYTDWDQGLNEVDVRGSYQLLGGNPGAFAQIYIPIGRDDRLGGYFEQSFEVTESNPDPAFVQFDTSVIRLGGRPRQFQAYVFVDTKPGLPSIGTEAWTSGQLIGTTAWASFGPIDITSRIAAPGTYYLKLAVWVDTTGVRAGPFTIGFDNALAYWEKAAGASYPTTSPSIMQKISFSSADVYAWHSFEEIATKNGGEIYYQLSDDGGATWQYWDGGTWAVAGSDNYSTAADIDAHIASFLPKARRITFKAFLRSDGVQQVSLDAVRLAYLVSASSGFSLSGSIVSSAYDTGAVNPVLNYIAWAASEPAGTIVRLQTRTADTEAGLAGAAWVGADGAAGSYYAAPGEVLGADPAATGLRWLQYRAELLSDGVETPILHDVTIDYEP